jgi:hypothetical protein
MTRTFLAVAVLAMALTPVGLAADKDGNKDKGKEARAGKHDSTQVAVNIFVGGDREIIREYVAKYPQGELPPGLAKRGGDLPPGLEKHLRKKGQLPPGLQKRVTALPLDLEGRLHPLEPGLKRGFLEGRAVIYNQKTAVVLDVLDLF